MFKSIRKGGRIAAVAIGLIAALTPLAAPPAALADGLPTPELEKSFTVDVEGKYSFAWFMNDGKYAIIDEGEDSNSNTIGYSRLDLTTGEVTPISLPKSKSCNIYSTLDGKRLYWRDGDKLIFFSIKDQQRTVHSLHIKKSEFLTFRLSEDGNTLTLYRDRDNDGKATKVDVFDLKSDEITFSYSLKKGEISATTSKDGKRLYIYSYRKKKSQLKVIDIPDGSTLIKEIPGNTKCDSISRVSRSDTLLIGANSDDGIHFTYFKADYDGNIDTVANGNKIWIYDASGTLLLAQIGENDDTIVIDSETGKQISYINRSDDEDSWLSISDISRNGDIALTGASSEKTNTIRLVDTRNGQRCDYKIKSNHRCRPCFVDNDRKIAVDYTDSKDSKKMHIDIYKSNIRYSLADSIIFFAEDHMPIVIGGGITVILVIGGVAIVCVRRRKKHSVAVDSTAAATHKAKKQKHGHRKMHEQPEQATQQPPVTPTAEPFATNPQQSSMPNFQQPTASSNPKFCRHCGTPLVPEAKFCPKCGHPVE